MRLLKDHFEFAIGTTTVTVTGESGVVYATWVLHFDGRPVDRARAAGDFTLRGTLPDGSTVEACVHQSLLGPTEVMLVHCGEPVGRGRGFVA